MGKTAFVFAALAAACASALAATPALAQRVFVAAQGSDANPCSFAQPCRTFQRAHNQAAAGGEIDVLDPAGYGALNITKAISIQGHGFAGISVAAGLTGIVVDAGATDAVNLNGLLIEGSGVGLTGIQFNSGKSLVMTNCVVRNVTQRGLQFFSPGSAPQTLSVADSYFSDNGFHGVFIQPHSSGAITAVIDRTVFSGKQVGVAVIGTLGTGALNVAVTDSVAANNASGIGVGFLVLSAAGQSPSSLVLTRATAVGNTVGIEASGANTTLRVSQSTVTGNASGFVAANGGSIVSFGDNYIDDNGGNAGALGSAAKQ
jgi:hypothetical protein